MKRVLRACVLIILRSMIWPVSGHGSAPPRHYSPARGGNSSRNAVTYNGCFMTAYVYVSLKKSVLDPQGKTIHGALKKMGYKGLEGVRQGKYFELTLDGGLSREQAQTEVERIAREVLTNPVIEEFHFSLAE
jgi:phosphoribosylformylglycinamidine synthase PurS subunit